MTTRLIPSRKVCEKFWITYDLKGCQKAVDFLTRHYGIRRMKVALNGKRMRKSYLACYHCDQHTAYFKKKGLTKNNVLHELYHHIAEVRGLEMSSTEEERQARMYSYNFIRKARG
jgi:transcription elongation factor Elf1